MAYLICINNFDNIQGSLCRIAENQSDLNNLNIKQDQYKIIEISQQDFEDIKFKRKLFDFYNGNNVTYVVNNQEIIKNEEDLKLNISSTKKVIKDFLDNNSNHPLYSKWNIYYNKLSGINTKEVIYPINLSLEQYVFTLNIDPINILQIP
jgi:hypothetical protein